MKTHDITPIEVSPEGFLRTAILAVALISASACVPVGGNVDTTHGWQLASSPKMLEVDRAHYRHVTFFSTDRDAIQAGERDRLLAFIKAVQPTSKDSIRVEGHGDERAGDVYNIDLAARRISSVETFLQDHGVEENVIQASAFGERLPVASASDEQAWSRNRRVEIIVERYVVTPPACPDWSRRSGIDYANRPHSNFGCATETNLGLMIANPRDLVRGRELSPADGVHQAEGVVRYREGKLGELQEERIN